MSKVLIPMFAILFIASISSQAIGATKAVGVGKISRTVSSGTQEDEPAVPGDPQEPRPRVPVAPMPGSQLNQIPQQYAPQMQQQFQMQQFQMQGWGGGGYQQDQNGSLRLLMAYPDELMPGQYEVVRGPRPEPPAPGSYVEGSLEYVRRFSGGLLMIGYTWTGLDNSSKGNVQRHFIGLQKAQFQQSVNVLDSAETLVFGSVVEPYEKRRLEPRDSSK